MARKQSNPLGLGFGIALLSLTTGLVLGGLIMSEEAMAKPASPKVGTGGRLGGVGKGLGLAGGGGTSGARGALTASDAIMLGLGAAPGLGGLQASASVPNISGDPAGYSTSLWTSSIPVRKALLALGYPVSQGSTKAIGGADKARVRQFQLDWNLVMRYVAKLRESGKQDIPTVVHGYLDTDGVPGKQTLNALEIIVRGNLDEPDDWQEIVAMSRIDIFKKGPGGKGRIYGKPNLRIPASLYTSNWFYVSPKCDWIIEGEKFLSKDYSAKDWAYMHRWVVTPLLEKGEGFHLNDIADAFMREVIAELGEEDFPYKGKLPQSGWKCFDKMTPVMTDWRADIMNRINAWMDSPEFQAGYEDNY